MISVRMCHGCFTLDGSKVELTPLYVKNKPSRMNSKQERYTIVAFMCSQCKRVTLK